MSSPLIIPADVTFEQTPEGLRLENEGDIELHRSLGRLASLRGVAVMLGAAEWEADAIVSGTLRAGGPITARVVQVGDHFTSRDAADGSVRVTELFEVSGSGDVAGGLRGGNARVGGNLRAGTVELDGLEVGGDLDVDGDLHVNRLHVGGAIHVGGNTVLGGDLEFDVLDLPGTVHLRGDLHGKLLRGDVIHLEGAAVNVRGIQARTRLVLGACKLTVDAIVAPEVVASAQTSGRASVIETRSELGRLQVKGCLSLADYAEMFGSPESFLAERGLVALDGAPVAAAAAPEVHVAAPAEAPAVEAEPATIEPEPAPVEPEPAPVEAAAPAVSEAEATAADPLEAGEAGEEEAQAAEDAADVVSVNVGRPVIAEPEPAPVVEAVVTEESVPDYAPIVVESIPMAVAADPLAADDPMAAAAEHPMHPQLASTVQRIVDCYQDAELPPAVDRLRTLVDERRYSDVRAEITNIWSELLKYHQKKGIRIHHQVTTTFNSVNSLVKKM